MSDLEKALELHKRALPALALELPREVFDDYLAIALPIDHAARKWASLTSPETIEKHARVYHKRWLEDSDGWYPEAWDDLEDEDRQWYLDLSEAQLEAVLRSVEEGTQ